LSARRTIRKIAVKRGGENVFADLGFDRPEEELLKAQLVREIRDILKRRRLTQTKAAELLGLKPNALQIFEAVSSRSSFYTPIYQTPIHLLEGLVVARSANK